MRLRSALFLTVPLCLSAATPPAQNATRYENQSVFSRHWKGILVDADCTPGPGRQVAGIVSPDMKSSQNPEQKGTAQAPAAHTPNIQTQGEASRSAELENNPDLATTTTREATSNTKTVRASTQADWRSCPATSATTHFGIVLPDGRLLRFDANGNSLTSAKASNGRLFPASATAPTVTVTGALTGESLEVKAIR